jgi:hypothetical protein
MSQNVSKILDNLGVAVSQVVSLGNNITNNEPPWSLSGSRSGRCSATPRQSCSKFHISVDNNPQQPKIPPFEPPCPPHSKDTKFTTRRQRRQRLVVFDFLFFFFFSFYIYFCFDFFFNFFFFFFLQCRVY